MSGYCEWGHEGGCKHGYECGCMGRESAGSSGNLIFNANVFTQTRSSG